MTREARDIVLTGPMPNPGSDFDSSQSSEGWNDFFSSDSSLDPRTALARLGIDYELEQQRMAEETERLRAERLAEHRQQQRIREVDELVRSLVAWGFDHLDIVRVLQGMEDTIDRVARSVRQQAHARQQQGGHPNAHSRTLTLLRRSEIPGSQEALDFLRQNWGERAEDVEREALRAEDDRIREDARGDYPASTRAILRGLGLERPHDPNRLGEPISVPDAQSDAQHRLQLGVRQFLAAYNGDIHFTLAQFLHAVSEYGEERGLSIIDITFRIRDALRDHVAFIDSQTGSSITSEEVADGRPTDSRNSDSGESDLRGRSDGHHDDATGRGRPGLLDL